MSKKDNIIVLRTKNAKKFRGYFVGRRGYLEQEKDSDDTKKNGKNGNGNGNGNGGSTNGNGAVMVAVMVDPTVVEE